MSIKLPAIGDVAWQIEKGYLRVASPDSVPPKKVLDRIGHDKLAEIKRFFIEGREVWIGRARFSYEWLILDANGRIVRAKKIVEAAHRLAQI